MHVNREGGLQSAARFESLYREWRHLTSKAESIGAAPLVQRRGELLHLMQQLAGAADQPAGTATGYAAIINQSQQPTLRSLASPPAASGQQLVPSASVGGLHSSAVSHLQSSPPAKAPQRGSTSQLSEAELLRDILYILLGSDGNHVKYHAPTDAFLLLPSLRVDRPQRILVQRVCELGWLYRKVQSYVTDIMGGANGALALPSAGATTRRGGTAAAPTTIETPAEHSGKIEQSFAATLREELNEYIRFITSVQGGEPGRRGRVRECVPPKSIWVASLMHSSSSLWSLVLVLIVVAPWVSLVFSSAFSRPKSRRSSVRLLPAARLVLVPPLCSTAARLVPLTTPRSSR